MSNQPIQVMRIADGVEDGQPYTLNSLEELADYSFNEEGSSVRAHTGFGQPILLAFAGPKDKVIIEILDYRTLRAQYSGTDPSVRKMIEDANSYLTRVDTELRKEQDRMFKAK